MGTLINEFKDSVENESGWETMSKQTWVGHSIDRLLPTEVEAFDWLAELALDMRWSWNHATEKVWRQLDPELWEITHSPWVILQTARMTRSSACWPIPFFARTLMAWSRRSDERWRRPRGFNKIIRRFP
jgi:glycogen phosphorylase